MDRRSFLFSASGIVASVTGIALLTNACGFSQARSAAKVPRIGYLSPPVDQLYVDAFLEGMRDRGYIEGQTVAIEWRVAPVGVGSEERFAELATELVRLPVDVLVAVTGQPARAASKATSSIPVVFVSVIWPEQTGLVTSLAHPGGNLTGFSASAPGYLAKCLDLLNDTVPGLSRIAALVDASNPTYSGIAWAEIRTAADQAGIHVERIDVRSETEVDSVFASAASSRAEAILDAQSPLLVPASDRVGTLALQYRLPAIFGVRKYVDSGALMAYTVRFADLHRGAAGYVDRILSGARPADLPVQQPTTYDLVVNANTLKSLGLTLGPSVLPLVTDWIQ
jgi:putative ABC transport system substrate-binding protein